MLADMSARGVIQGMESRESYEIVMGSAPLAAMPGYATDLRSRTQGGMYTMQFQSYDAVPPGEADKIIARYLGRPVE